MLFQESETVELKEVVVDDIKKEIIAFANCDGGKLYIGIRNDGTVAGLDNPDGVSLQISDMVRDAIKPDVTMFPHYRTMAVCSDAKEEGYDYVEVYPHKDASNERGALNETLINHGNAHVCSGAFFLWAGAEFAAGRIFGYTERQPANFRTGRVFF